MIILESTEDKVIGRIFQDGKSTPCFVDYIFLPSKLRKKADLILGKPEKKKRLTKTPVIPEVYEDPDDNEYF